MSKLASKRFVSLIVLLWLTAFLIACSTMGDMAPTKEQATVPTVNEVDYSDFGFPVSENHKIHYLVPNAFLIKDSESNTQNNRYTQYPVFSGLKDEAVEAALNDAVVGKVEEIKTLLNPETIAPFRGIKTRVSEDSRVVNQYVHGYTSFNANNIISIQFHGSAEYSLSGSTWISLIKGLTIDLNTGKSIPLSAVFVDGFDYKRVINDAIYKEIGKLGGMDVSGDSFIYQLVKPFSGITDDQPFSLTEQGVMIYFDEKDDHFDSMFNTVSFLVDYSKFGDYLALDRRYYDEAVSLFADERQRRMFVPWNDETVRLSENDYGMFEGGQYSMNIFSNTSVLDELFMDIQTEMKEKIMGMALESSDNFIDVFLSKSRLGDFVQIISHFNVYSKNVSQSEYAVYLCDKEGTQLALRDLFIPDFDYDAVIIREIEKACAENPAYNLEKIMEAYESLTYQLHVQGIIIEIRYDAPDHYMNQIWHNIPYHEFGIDNLTIFDPVNY